MTKTKNCNNCQGTGYVGYHGGLSFNIWPSFFTNVVDGKAEDEVKSECPKCDGTGKLPIEND